MKITLILSSSKNYQVFLLIIKYQYRLKSDWRCRQAFILSFSPIWQTTIKQMWAFKCGHWVRRKKQPISWGECVVRHRQRKSAQRGKITPIIFLVYDAKPMDAFVFFYSRARTSKSLKVHSQCSAQGFLWIFYFHPFLQASQIKMF